MYKTIEFLINKKNSGERLDVFLSKKINNFTRSYIKKLIEKNNVKLNKIINTSPSTKIKTNDKITVNILDEISTTIVPSKIKLDIIYEDKDLLIINKPKGMVVHPGAGNHKDTTGLLVIAKNNLTHSNLGKQFSDHSIKRKYQCLVWGVIRPLSGRIETLITRNKKNRQLMTVSEINGKKAITNYKTIKVFNIKDIPKISLLECELETGRTHQIRVHLKYKGTSLLGDKQYGKKNIKFKRINNEFFLKLNKLSGQALHAKTLEFVHPKTKKWMSFNSELPDGFKKILNLLENLSS